MQLDKLSLPPGFHIEVYATVPGARSIAVSPNSSKYDIIYVGSMTDAQKVGARCCRRSPAGPSWVGSLSRPHQFLD